MPDDLESWARLLTLLPIILCSVAGSALAAWKWRQLHRARRAGARLFLQVQSMLGRHDVTRALAVVQRDPSPAARLIERALAAAGAPHDRLAAHVAQAGHRLARDIDYGLGGLALIATLGPLLGLFGTVVGIVIVFDRLAGAAGAVSPQMLAGGIGTALITTVAGLVVGMLALVSHRLIEALADEAIDQLEALGHELVTLLEGSAL